MSESTKCCACAGICASRFTKYCACHEICISRFTNVPRNLHFEVHQVLCLPRNLHFIRGSPSAVPTKSALRGSPSSTLRGSQSAATATKSALRGSQRSLRIEVHQVLCLPRNLRIEVHQVLCLPRNLRFEVHQVLPLPRNLHIEGHRVLCLPRNLQTSHMSKSHDSPHLSRNLSSSTITTMSKVLHLPPAQSKTAPTPSTCHEKSTKEAPKHEVSLAPATNSDHHVPKCGAQSLEAPAAATQIQRACAVEMHFEDFERHECTLNSKEVAVHARALQRSKHQLPFIYRKDP